MHYGRENKTLADLLFAFVLVIGSFSTIVFFNNYPAAHAKQEINPVIFWNQITARLAMEDELPPTKIARAYVLVHVSIYDSLLISHVQNSPNILTERAVVNSAASTVLSYLFPDDAERIKETVNMFTHDNDSKISLDNSMRLGKKVGQEVVGYAKNDGSDLVFSGYIPKGKCIWNGTDPVTPMAGFWKTYILNSASEIQPSPPEPCESEVDINNMREILEISNKRNTEQVNAVHYWGDLPPPTIWNNILNEEIEIHTMSLFDAARASAYVNIDLYDACISTWYTKYTYWTARPYQRLSNFTTIIATPNFPGYTSGHSTMSAAASEVMSEFFPDQQDKFYAKANEAKMSRLWAGIHFTQDNEQGADVGIQIGKKIVTDARSIPHTFISEYKAAGR